MQVCYATSPIDHLLFLSYFFLLVSDMRANIGSVCIFLRLSSSCSILVEFDYSNTRCYFIVARTEISTSQLTSSTQCRRERFAGASVGWTCSTYICSNSTLPLNDSSFCAGSPYPQKKVLGKQLAASITPCTILTTMVEIFHALFRQLERPHLSLHIIVKLKKS